MPGPAKKPVGGGGKKRGKGEVVEVVAVEEALTIVPPDQVKLTQKQLDDELTKVLTATNPQLTHNLVSYKCVSFGLPLCFILHPCMHLHAANSPFLSPPPPSLPPHTPHTKPNPAPFPALWQLCRENVQERAPHGGG
jgi:hypothetical protein